MKTIAIQNKPIKLNWNSTILSVGLSILFIISGNIQFLIGVFPYMFMKGNIEKIIFILPTILLYLSSPIVLFQAMVYMSGYFILSGLVRKVRGNSLLVYKLYVSIFAGGVSYIMNDNILHSVSLFVIQMIYHHEMMKSFDWLKKNTSLPSSIYSLIVITLMILTSQYMNEYQEIFLVIGFIFICFGCSPLISITSLFMVHLFLPLVSYETFVYILLLSLLKDQIGLMILVFFGLFVTQASNLYEILILGLYLVFSLLLSKEGSPVQTNELQLSNSKTYLHKQLINFSLIFDHLATYYENVSKIESDFLKSMGNALLYTSRKCQQDDLSVDYIKNQVVSILEGYNIGYEEINVENNEEGYIRIECTLLNFSANEVKEVLLPLLNHLLPTPMECLSMRSSWLELGVLNVEFVSTPPLQIDAYADNAPVGKMCGDSFSIFNHSLNVYCLISDGMGSGKEAHKISKCIVNLFQRMIFSNIHEIEAMGCINKLLLSDSYATCDVLIFNRFKKTVTICKSAANPTYLVRNNELFAIWGNSLPIGIVAHIDVDTIHVQIEKGDFFIMSSDGVSVDEIVTWMNKSKGLNSRKEVERFMEILKTNKREDDSTILLAKVN